MQSSADYCVSPVEYCDYIELIKLYREFHEESYARDIINFDIDATINFLNSLMENPDRNFARKCTLKDVIVGFYMGSISTMDFSTTSIGFERGFYVRRESRGSRAAVMLKYEFFDWLTAKGVKPVIATIFHSENNESTVHFCEKMGMRVVGQVLERIL